MNPSISIVIPTYNSAKVLPLCLESLKNEIIALIDSDNILPSRDWLVHAGDKNKNH